MSPVDPAPTYPSFTADTRFFLISVDILWRVSLADCLFVSDCSSLVHNPLLFPNRREAPRTHWLHRTPYLPAFKRRHDTFSPLTTRLTPNSLFTNDTLLSRPSPMADDPLTPYYSAPMTDVSVDLLQTLFLTYLSLADTESLTEARPMTDDRLVPDRMTDDPVPTLLEDWC